MVSLISQSMYVESTCNGVFGEFLQGVGSNNLPFLITAPINVFSKAAFCLDPNLKRIKLTNSNKSKSQELADRVFETCHLNVGGSLTIETFFPVGKGLGSSSADLVSTANVLNQAYNLNWSSAEIENYIRGIEPTDGVMYDGIVSYYYKDVKLNKRLGSLKDCMILGVDEGGVIDTVEYNRIERFYDTSSKQMYENLHAMAEKAIRERDISLLGKVSTRSGQLNQTFNPKQYLEEFVKISEKLELPGVIIAHSGTYIGFIFDLQSRNFHKQIVQTKGILNSYNLKYEEFYILGEGNG